MLGKKQPSFRHDRPKFIPSTDLFLQKLSLALLWLLALLLLVKAASFERTHFHRRERKEVVKLVPELRTFAM